MKKVKFANGKYGIRTYWFFGWYFLDLESPVYSWKGGTKFFPCCVGSEERADAVLHVQHFLMENVKSHKKYQSKK